MLPEAKLDVLLARHAALEAELTGQLSSDAYVRATRELSAKIDGKATVLTAGQSATVPAGVPHDWWNASKTENAEVLVEVDAAPGHENADSSRFELLIARGPDVVGATSEHVRWRDKADRAVQALVIVVIDERGDEAPGLVE